MTLSRKSKVDRMGFRVDGKSTVKKYEEKITLQTPELDVKIFNNKTRLTRIQNLKEI